MSTVPCPALPLASAKALGKACSSSGTLSLSVTWHSSFPCQPDVQDESSHRVEVPVKGIWPLLWLPRVTVIREIVMSLPFCPAWELGKGYHPTWHSKRKASAERRRDLFQVMQQISGQEQKPAPTSLLRPLFLLLSADLCNVCFNHQTMFVFMVGRSSHKARPHDIGSSLPWWGRWVGRWRKLSVPQVLPKSGILPDFGTGNFLWRLLNFWTLCPTNAPLSWGKEARGAP